MKNLIISGCLTKKIQLKWCLCGLLYCGPSKKWRFVCLLKVLCSCTDEDFENFWLLDQENTIEMVPLLKTPLLFLWSASGPSNVKHFYGFYVPAKMKKEKKVFSPWQTPSLFLRGILLCLLCSSKDEQREKIVFFGRLHCFSSLHLTPSTTARALPANIKPE